MKRELRDVLLQMGELERAMGEKETLHRRSGPRNRRTDRTAAATGRREARVRAPGHDLGAHAAPAGKRDDAGARAALHLRARTAARGRRAHASAKNSSPRKLSELSAARRAAAQRSKPRCRPRRAAWRRCASGAMKRRNWPAKFARNVATLEERRRGAMLTVQRIEAMLSEVSAHLAKLKSQLESAAAEKQQREAENVRLAEQVVELDRRARSRAATRSRTAGRVAGRPRPHCRVGRGTEVGARGARRRTRSSRRALGRAGARASPMCSTWPRPACRNSASSTTS